MNVRLLPWLRQSLNVTWVLVARGAGTLVKFAMNVLLGRVLGADGTGYFVLFQSWAAALGVAGSLGLPTYTLRTVAVLEADEGGAQASRRFVSRAVKIGVLGGAAIILLPFVFSPLLAQWLLPSSRYAYIIRAGAAAGLATSVLTIFTEALTARGQVVTAMQLESVAVPAAMVIFLGSALLLGRGVSPEPAIYVYVLASLLALWLARQIWVKRAARGPRPDSSARVPAIHFPDLAPFWGIGVVVAVANNLPILALPFFASPADIGRFGIAQRMATMSLTILDALGNIFMPAFAREYARHNASGLRRELSLSQLYSCLAYLPFVVLFVFLARPVLGLVGEDFLAAQRFLLILMLGQLFNAATGLAGALLNMVHRQHINLYVSIGHLVFTLVMIPIMGNLYGALGIAITTSAAVAIKNLIFFVLARVHISLDARLWETST